MTALLDTLGSHLYSIELAATKIIGVMTFTGTISSRKWKRLGLLPVVPLLALSAACTSVVSPDKQPLPEFESVVIVSAGATRELKARFGVPPGDSGSTDGWNAGLGVGATAAAGVSLGCGPFAFLCALATVPIGAGIGAVSGALAGVVADAHQMPPDKQLLILDSLFAEITAQRTIHLDVQDSLQARMPPGRLVDTSVAEALIQLSLSDIRFVRTPSGKYAWALKSVMVASWDRTTGHQRYGYRIYDCSSRSLVLDDWVDNDGKILNEALDACVDSLAEQMAEDIRFKDA